MSVGVQQASETSAESTFDPASFSRSRRYEATGTAGTILVDMEKLREFDGTYERKNLFWKFVIAIGFGFILIGVLCLFSDSQTPGIVIGGIGLATILTGIFMLARYSGLDLDNRRYELVVGLLGLLRKDMAADQPVMLTIDFRKHNHKAKFVRSGKAGRWDAKFYVDRWLEMRGRLMDGSKYSVTLIEKHQDRTRTKRSASGKTKYKSKTKTSSEAIVSLKFKEKAYPSKPPNDLELLKSVKLPGWVEVKTIKAEGDLLTIRATTSVAWKSGRAGQDKVAYDGVHWLAMMFMNLYQQLNRSRQ